MIFLAELAFKSDRLLDSGTVRLEMVTRNRPREIGVLELQEENGFYSVITAYQLSWARSKVRGKLVWQYSVPQVPSDKQQAGPLNPLSADKVASTARLSRLCRQ